MASREPSIADYALLSDGRTAALVGRDGSVDWYCPPRFDSPSVFARLLDTEGGHFSVRPAGAFETRPSYLGDTMVLRTEFSTGAGRAALTDALALEEGAWGHEIGLRSPHTLLRRVEGTEGEGEISLEFVPRLEYGLTSPLVLGTGYGAVARAGPVEIHLFGGCPLEVGDTRTGARFVVRTGEAADFALVYRRAAVDGGDPAHPDIGAGLENARAG